MGQSLSTTLEDDSDKTSYTKPKVGYCNNHVSIAKELLTCGYCRKIESTLHNQLIPVSIYQICSQYLDNTPQTFLLYQKTIRSSLITKSMEEHKIMYHKPVKLYWKYKRCWS